MDPVKQAEFDAENARVNEIVDGMRTLAQKWIDGKLTDTDKDDLLKALVLRHLGMDLGAGQ